MADEITISLTDGQNKIKVDEEFADQGIPVTILDSQDVTFVDGGDITSVEIAMFGMIKDGDKDNGMGDNAQDRFFFDLSEFDDTFEITIKSEDLLDQIILSDVVAINGVPFDPSGGEVELRDDDPTDDNVGIETFTIEYRSASAPNETTIVTVSPGFATIIVTCFAKGTLIRTPTGEIPIEDLAPGDLVDTFDHGPQPIRWIARRRLSHDTLRERPNLQPVRIKAGTAIAGAPARDLVVSQQHRVLVSGPYAELLFEEGEALAPAKSLLSDCAITLEAPAEGVEYYHMVFDQHELVWAEGAISESFYPDQLALEGLSAAQREELAAIFPAECGEETARPEAARKLLSVAEGRVLGSLTAGAALLTAF